MRPRCLFVERHEIKMRNKMIQCGQGLKKRQYALLFLAMRAGYAMRRITLIWPKVSKDSKVYLHSKLQNVKNGINRCLIFKIPFRIGIFCILDGFWCPKVITFMQYLLLKGGWWGGGRGISLPTSSKGLIE